VIIKGGKRGETGGSGGGSEAHQRKASFADIAAKVEIY
jgi:hypothetical protein